MLGDECLRFGAARHHHHRVTHLDAGLGTGLKQQLIVQGILDRALARGGVFGEGVLQLVAAVGQPDQVVQHLAGDIHAHALDLDRATARRAKLDLDGEEVGRVARLRRRL